MQSTSSLHKLKYNKNFNGINVNWAYIIFVSYVLFLCSTCIALPVTTHQLIWNSFAILVQTLVPELVENQI